MGWQWHLLAHMQIITQSFTGQMLFLTPNQQCQSTEGKKCQNCAKNTVTKEQYQ